MDLKQAIEIIESHQWCSIRAITAHVVKGTGGKVLEIAKARIARSHRSSTLNPESANSTGRANHSANFTRNMELPNKQIRTIHPILITHINNIAVV